MARTLKVDSIQFGEDHKAPFITRGPGERELVLEADLVTGAGGTGGVTVRRNSGADVGTRPRLNFIEGANITLGVVDDAGDDEVDITITGASTGAPTDAQYVTLALNGSLTDERVLTGTANQISLADGGANGNIVLSTPQDIHSAATPTFGALTLSSASTPVFSFTTIQPGASVEIGRLISFSVSPADDDEFYFAFRSNDAGLSAHEFARLTVVSTDVTNASEDGALEFDVTDGGTLRRFLRLEAIDAGQNAVRVNPDNTDIDFVVPTTCGATFTVNNGGDSVDGTSDLTLNWAGSAFFTGQFFVTNNNQPSLTITQTNSGVTAEALRLVHDSASAADDDEVSMAFYLDDDLGASSEFARITAISRDITSTSKDGALIFEAQRGNVLQEFLRLESPTTAASIIVLNEGSTDMDFRMEASGLPNMMLMDAGLRCFSFGGAIVQNSFFRFDAGAANRVRATNVGIAMDFAADTYTQTNTGTLAVGTMVRFDTPTFAATGAATLTDPATFYISGAPVAGTNMTFTNAAKALWVANGLTQLDNAAGAALHALIVTNTTDAAASAVARFANDRAAGAASDSAYVSFYLDDEDGDPAENSRIAWEQSVASSGDQDGTLTLSTVFNNSLERQVTFQGRVSPGTTFNPDQLDINFVIASPNLANAFEMDAGRDAIGIGDGAESESLFLLSGVNASRSRVSGQGILMETRAGIHTQTNADPTTLAIGTLVSFQTPTFAGANPNQTLTDAATFYIAGAPVAGTNMTITNTPLALWVDSGDIRFDGQLRPETQQTYTATGQAARNADTATTVALLQDVVQTLIDDLQTIGLLG